MIELTKFELSYVETMLWSSTDSEGVPLDASKYSDAEFTEAAKERIRKDCSEFLARIQPILDALDGSVLNSMPDMEHIAHDFWLTRNHHGAGFWDGDYPDAVGKELTRISHTFGECWPGIENNQIYID